jgi:hypothetical protein
MQENIIVNSASTVYIAFTSEMPKLFLMIDADGDVEYFRYMDGKTPRIRFNIPVPGSYTFNCPFSLVKMVPIEVNYNLPVLPSPERDRLKEPVIVYDPGWTISVASNFTEEGVIVHGPGWLALIKPIRLFIDLHEVGHFFYRTEQYCDLYALVNFLRMGYNRSTAFYALTKVLGRSPEAMDRIKSMFSTITKTTGEFSPE